MVLSVAISGAFPALTDWLVAMGLPVARSIVGTATVQQDRSSNGSGPSSSQALLLGSSSSTNGLSASSSSWQVQAPVLTPIDPSRRDFSLHGARADMSEFRVVDGEYASHKVALSCKGQDWAVWRRSAPPPQAGQTPGIRCKRRWHRGWQLTSFALLLLLSMAHSGTRNSRT